MRQPLLFLAITMSVCVLLPGPVLSQPGVIRVPGDAPTITAAIAMATNNDAILLDPGTYNESNMVIDPAKSPLKIASFTGIAGDVVIDAGGNARIFSTGATLALEGLVLKNCSDVAIKSNGPQSVTLTTCTIRDCQNGGADIDHALVTGSSFINNTTSDLTRGGGLTIHGTLTMTNSLFSGNQAENGGGLLALGATVQLLGCTFDLNSASVGGGAKLDSTWFRLENTTFKKNVSGGAGGGLWASKSTLTELHPITDCYFLENTAGMGGGVYVADLPAGAQLALTRVIGSQNTVNSGNGGFAYLSGLGNLSVSGTTVDANTAGTGSGFYMNGNVTTLGTSIIAFGAGDAVYCTGGSSLTVTCTDIFGNSGGDWVDNGSDACLAGQNGTGNNISADPQFCSEDRVTDKNWTLQSDSPAIPGISGCQLMGAFSQGCDTTPVQNTTWGRIKTTFGN